jgi:hypothetical protein
MLNIILRQGFGFTTASTAVKPPLSISMYPVEITSKFVFSVLEQHQLDVLLNNQDCDRRSKTKIKWHLPYLKFEGLPEKNNRQCNSTFI